MGGGAEAVTIMVEISARVEGRRMGRIRSG